jgi:hypothetical protein
MRNVLPEADPNRQRFVALRDPLGGEAEQREWIEQGAKHQTKRRVLCDPCNTVWGSQLETATKRVLAPMIHRAERDVTGDEARTLARWAMKVTILREFLDPERMRVITREQRHRFRRTNEPTSPIFIGTIGEGERWSVRGRDRHATFGLDPPTSPLVGQFPDAVTDKANAHISTFAFGAVVFFVIGITVAYGSINDLARIVEPNPLERLWPGPYTFHWPLDATLSDGDLDRLSGDEPLLWFPVEDGATVVGGLPRSEYFD